MTKYDQPGFDANDESYISQSIKPDFEKSRETLHSMSKALFNEREKLIQEVLVRVYGDEKIIEV